MALALEVFSIAVKLTVSLYARYWLNLVIDAFAAPVSIIILYYLLELYWEVSLEVVKYAKGKVDLLGTTSVSICWVIKLLNFSTVDDMKCLAYLVFSLRLSIKV
jgi:hypothetical protein